MWQRGVIAIIFAALTIWLGYFVEQEQFLAIIAGYAPFFLLYLFVYVRTEKAALDFWLGVGVFLRIILLFSFPNLSDDIYRFVWDGHLINHGFNPFDHLPGYYIENDVLPGVLTPELYNLLNSKEYYTVYPPVLQAIFAVSTWLFPQSIAASGVAMKSFLLLGEIGSIWLIGKLLMHFKLPAKNALLYALNPLVIVEVTGNIHFEGLMVFFLLLAFWWLRSSTPKMHIGSALAMAGSIASKLLPLMFLPFLIKKMGWRSVRYFTIIGVALLLLFAPLLNGLFFNNFGASLDLYFRRFEFNASLFYILEWIYLVVFNEDYVNLFLGPALAFVAFFAIIALVVWRRASWRALPTSWLFAVSIYLLCTTTVHPWYLCLPVALSVFTNWRYPIAWSGLVVLSYSHYWGGVFYERFEFIILEYVILLGYFIYEAFYLRKLFKASRMMSPPG